MEKTALLWCSGLLGAEFGWNSWQNDVFSEEHNFEAAKEINMSYFNLKSWTTWKWNRAFQSMEKKKKTSLSNVFSCLMVSNNPLNHSVLTEIILPLLVAWSDQQSPNQLLMKLCFWAFTF